MSSISLHRLSSAISLVCAAFIAVPLLAAPSVPRARSDVKAHYATIPLSFEANEGQANPAVEFLSHGRGYTLALRHGNATLSLMRSNVKNGGSQVQLTLAGANSNARAVREGQQITRTNYFPGGDAKLWHTNIPNYARVKYNGIYPGIDLVYYGNQQRLEHDFIVAPGADPSQISFTIRGASHTRIDPVTGDLTLSTDSGELRFLKPESYQRLGSRQTPVASSYRLLARNKIAFRIGRYNHTQPLIIDPVLTYATFLDGSTAEYIYGLAVDTSGNSYLTGSTQSTDFPTTTGAYSTTDSATYRAAFVSKLNAAGTALIYSTFLGGGHSNSGLAIAVNTAGEAYLTGTGDTSAYPTTGSAFQKTSYGYDNAVFVTKLSAAGDSLVYSTYLGNGGNGGDAGNAIAVDTAGNAYVTGRAYGGSFPSMAAVLQPGPGYGANSSAFVAKINPNGSSLVYSTYLGGTTLDTIGYAIQIDSAGDAYVGGSTDSADFPTTAGAFQTVNHSSSSTNGFVSKLNPTGTALLYSTFLGGSSPYGDAVNGLAIDSAGDAFAVGATNSTDFPVTAGALQTTDPGATAGSQSGFVFKLNPNGTALIYSTYLGSSGTGYPGDSGNAVAVDSSGNAYVTGQTASTGFPTTPEPCRLLPATIFR
jgi:hypothetical protein